jgi:hypothetical protein
MYSMIHCDNVIPSAWFSCVYNCVSDNLDKHNFYDFNNVGGGARVICAYKPYF